ncbi:GntR family transcriptional regulator [Ilumatobacter sp.]|uniref:GntR family transcriptional regulator n=1 Tax=Ilumatobacter sp. TaxID=1967498 RepID=UPI0037516B26
MLANAVFGSDQPPTRTEWAEQRLRHAILRGEFGPGDALVISTLAEQMGLSATPLHEAVRNLSADGLVELHSHGKARVAQVDLHEANEIYELRLMLEPVALERAVRHADDGYRDRVESAWKALAATRIASPSDHAAFHRALLSTCDSAWLLRMATTLADRAGLMITVGLPSRPDDYDTAAAHRTLKDLALAGDGAAAAAELRRHLSGTIAALHLVVGATMSENANDARQNDEQ